MVVKLFEPLIGDAQQTARDRLHKYRESYKGDHKPFCKGICLDLRTTIFMSDARAISPWGNFVYFLFGAAPRVPIYIGQSTNVFARIGAHVNGISRGGRLPDPHELIDIALMRFETEDDMALAERLMINHFTPKYNRQ